MNTAKKVLISACLMGAKCRYDGGDNAVDLSRLMEMAELIPVCPEQLGGLRTPRTPAERIRDRVVTRDGDDVTQAYEKGAERVLEASVRRGVCCALMKERSPSCGSGEIYDGSFTHTRIPGDGVAAALLKANGIPVFGESRIADLLAFLEEETK